MKVCNKCGATRCANGDRLKTCSKGCKAKYCSKDCQYADWASHRISCPSYQDNKCWICKKSGTDEKPLYRDCACRGKEGFGHLSCFVSFAKLPGNSNHFLQCPHCEEIFSGKISDVIKSECGDVDYNDMIARKASYLENFQALYGEVDMLLDVTAAESMLLLAQGSVHRGLMEEALDFLSQVDQTMRSGRVSAEWKEKVEPTLNECYAHYFKESGQYSEALPYAEENYKHHVTKKYEQNASDGPKRIFAMGYLFDIYVNLGKLEKAMKVATDTTGLSSVATEFHQSIPN